MNVEKEPKEIRSKIQILKKSLCEATKEDRKSIKAEIKSLEYYLDSLKEEISLPEKEEPKNVPYIISKAKLRIMKKNQHIEALIEKGQEDSLTMKDFRAEERQKFYDSLKKTGLVIKEIPADGDCLYNAVIHQLPPAQSAQITAKALRLRAAEYLRRNRDKYIDFIFCDNLNMHEAFDNFCRGVEGSEWGGHIELQVLSELFHRPIRIYRAEENFTEINAEFGTDPLLLSYHVHEYHLGEHYNSLVRQSTPEGIEGGEIKSHPNFYLHPF